MVNLIEILIREDKPMFIKSLVRRIRGEKNQKGAAMIEYALLAALIALAAILVLTNLGSGVKDVFTDIQTALTNI